MVTIKVNDRTKAGKIFLELAKSLSKNSKAISIQENEMLSVDDIVVECRKARHKIAKTYNAQ